MQMKFYLSQDLHILLEYQLQVDQGHLLILIVEQSVQIHDSPSFLQLVVLHF